VKSAKIPTQGILITLYLASDVNPPARNAKMATPPAAPPASRPTNYQEIPVLLVKTLVQHAILILPLSVLHARHPSPKNPTKMASVSCVMKEHAVNAKVQEMKIKRFACLVEADDSLRSLSVIYVGIIVWSVRIMLRNVLDVKMGTSSTVINNARSACWDARNAQTNKPVS
jgi:hypothetical protein